MTRVSVRYDVRTKRMGIRVGESIYIPKSMVKVQKSGKVHEEHDGQDVMK